MVMGEYNPPQCSDEVQGEKEDELDPGCRDEVRVVGQEEIRIEKRWNIMVNKLIKRVWRRWEERDGINQT